MAFPNVASLYTKSHRMGAARRLNARICCEIRLESKMRFDTNTNDSHERFHFRELFFNRAGRDRLHDRCLSWSLTNRSSRGGICSLSHQSIRKFRLWHVVCSPEGNRHIRLNIKSSYENTRTKKHCRAGCARGLERCLGNSSCDGWRSRYVSGQHHAQE
jgi:hypothetical protein